ncbi:type VI secretion system tip protein TssI/VgrG [Paraburkholderia sp. D15]|uniref:type VI secretion system Vgr family protein n=1 Tax=Paraburkholderia sp. D15 TaxID=2880218 RepID=UPI0024792FCD|nr:type VI secretion system Vgr family protein [Paraburkholderia sp. D15]WGS49816.1 type VI secretion system tip protein TssI/VgrG [Paraburkholderia sp. D15]
MSQSAYSVLMDAGIEQSHRAVILNTPLGAKALLPQRVVGESRVGREMAFTVDVVAKEKSVELKRLMGQPVTLWLLQADQSYLPWHGYVFATRRLGGDGGLTYYQLSFASWMRLLKYRKDARIFQDLTTTDILRQVFNGHPLARGKYRFATRDPGMTRSYCTQYESDENFVRRLLESEGWFTYIEQATDGKSHTVVITDDFSNCRPLAGQQIPFGRADREGQTGTLVEWGSERTLQSVAYGFRTADYKVPTRPKERSGSSQADQGDLPANLEVYEYAGHYSFPAGDPASDRGDQAVRIRLEEMASQTKRFFGVGSVTGMDAGRSFTLKDHPEHDLDKQEDRQFGVIATRWFIQNNLPLGNSRPFPHSLQRTMSRVRAEYREEQSAFTTKDPLGNESFFLIEIEAQRRLVPYRSPFEHRKPVMHMQSATVVGPSGEEIYTDGLNRIKVQMHWDRIGNQDAAASCWMRVVMPQAGNNFGSVFVPRTGQEVAVSYFEGDCDRPVVTGVLFHSINTPHWNTNGLLSGFKSREYSGRGFNQLVFDDSTAQSRAQLYSSTANSYLHVGYLINHDGNTRGSYLGNGFEMKTDAFGAVRAGQGLYVSTYARGGTTSQQLDTKEATQHLLDSSAVVQRRSLAATDAKAEPLDESEDDIKAFAAATQSNAQRSPAGGRTGGGGTGTANAFSEPIMLFASPSGLGLSTQQSMHVTASRHINVVSGDNAYVAVARSWIASVGEKLSFFVQNAGMKLFAAKGKVEIQAQSDNIEITADKTLKVASTSDSVSVTAQKEITLSAGGATIRIASGNIYIHAPGLVQVKGSPISFEGPEGSNPVVTSLPSKSCAQQFAAAAQTGSALV